MHGRGEISLLPLPGYDGLTYVAGGLRCQFLCNFYKRLASGSLFNLFSDCLLCPLMRPSCRFCFKLFVYSLLGGKTAGRKPCRKGRSIMNGSRLKSCLRMKDRRGDQRGVNGSQSKFLTEFGLYPKINPNPQLTKSDDAENRLGYSCCAMA
jgi:hypothetical protein